jgi:hypothetical protein
MTEDEQYDAELSMGVTPEAVVLDLSYEIARNELDCVDNRRYARVGNTDEEKAYYDRALTGCCGAFDTFTTVNGVKWAIGCNYGH